MDIGSIISAQNPIAATNETAAPPIFEKGKADLGMFDFLKLLTVQLTHQDPLSPIEDSAFIAQMAQFSSLQEISRMNVRMTDLHGLQQWSSSQQLIGQTVQYTDEEGAEHLGVVTGIHREAGESSVLIDDKHVPLSSVHSIYAVDADAEHETPASE